MLPQKYLIAVIGDANDGKTTTICKAFHKMNASGVILHPTTMPGFIIPAINSYHDFSLTGNTIYGLTGFISRGDVIYTLKNDLDNLVRVGCNVIICACRRNYPATFNAVAQVSWESDYSIIWIKFNRPTGVTQDAYTDDLSDKILHLFK
jgi:hypothetical protein